MQKKEQKRTIEAIIIIFAFQLLFPQYSYAHGLDVVSSGSGSIVLLSETSEPIIMSYTTKTNSGLPEAENRKPTRKMTVAMSAYSSTVDQCDSDPFTTASGARVKDGIIATNALPFHTKIKIPSLYGDKVFVVEDRMNKRYTNKIDIWMETRQEAIQFGVKTAEIEIFEE